MMILVLIILLQIIYFKIIYNYKFIYFKIIFIINKNKIEFNEYCIFNQVLAEFNYLRS